MEISQSGLADPTDETGRWACVKVKPVRKLKRPVTLKQIKSRSSVGRDRNAAPFAPVGQRDHARRMGLYHRSFRGLIDRTSCPDLGQGDRVPNGDVLTIAVRFRNGEQILKPAA
jgi:hypothetical protein